MTPTTPRISAVSSARRSRGVSALAADVAVEGIDVVAEHLDGEDDEDADEDDDEAVLDHSLTALGVTPLAGGRLCVHLELVGRQDPGGGLEVGGHHRGLSVHVPRLAPTWANLDGFRTGLHAPRNLSLQPPPTQT